MSADFVEEYRSLRPLYDACQQAVVRLVEQLLDAAGVGSHSVAGRAKTVDSLAGKISRPGKSYGELGEITDLAAVRVILYFGEDVDQVAYLLRREFSVVPALSVDKREPGSPNEFGYQSLHLILEFSDARAALPEYGRFAGIRFEVQLRTVLQHAWAEIEHDIGYKSAIDLPKPVRRRFAMLSALLELADGEFQRIRQGLTDYQEEIASSVLADPERVGLDRVALLEFVEQSPLVAQIASEIGRRFEVMFGQDADPTWLAGIPLGLSMVGADSIKGLVDLLERYRSDLVGGWDIVFDLQIETDWTKEMILFALVLVAAVLESEPGEEADIFQAIRIQPQETFGQEVRARKSDQGQS